MDRIRIKIAGESGGGLLASGEIVTRALEIMGFNVVADREYPSLIKGGHSCFVINASRDDIFALSSEVDVMLVMSKWGFEAYYDDLKKGGVLVHGYDKQAGIYKELEANKKKNTKVVYLPSLDAAMSVGGNALTQNIVLVGMLWKALGLEYKYVKKSVEVQFASKPKLLEVDLKCLKAGYDGVESVLELKKPSVAAAKTKRLLLDGNKAIALGAAHAGCRAYFAYPMSPSSSILTHLAEMSHNTGMVVKQCEDEITVANMTVGAMYAGTRSMCATSGGGFDLMTETLSLTGIIENPMVVVLCQRPGPGTGLPTWTGQGDLNIAMHSGHGEFARVVIAVSNPSDSFKLIQHAFNIAEEYQCLVVVLSEKSICETKMSVPVFKQNTIPIKRGLVQGAALKKLENEDRFRITKDGLSKRWVPGSTGEAYYFANGDEHWEDGSLEEGERAGEMYEKRMRKLELIRKNLPEPVVYGPARGADISFIGWGNTKNVMLDIIDSHKKSGIKVNYLHFEYVYPLKEKTLKSFFKNNKNVHLIEGNYTGQFGNMVEHAVMQKFKNRLVKWNGRPFFLEDVEDYIKKHK